MIADVADGPFHPALLVAAGHRHRPGFEPVVTGQGQQGGMKADRLALTLQHGALQVIVEQDSGDPAKGLEGRDMAAQEVLHASVQEKRRKIRRE